MRAVVVDDADARPNRPVTGPTVYAPNLETGLMVITLAIDDIDKTGTRAIADQTDMPERLWLVQIGRICGGKG